MKNLRPNTHRAKYAKIMIAVVMGLEVISLMSDYLQYKFVHTVLYSDSYISMSAVDANDNRQQGIGILYMIAFIISAITFIQWFRRAYYNLGQVRNDLKHTNGWASAAWFIPIVCIFLPYQIMKELYNKTSEYLRANENYSGKNSKSTMRWWWGFWLLSNFISNIATKILFKANTPQALEDGTIASMFGSVTMVVTGLLLLKVINDYSKLEPLLQEENSTLEIEEETI